MTTEPTVAERLQSLWDMLGHDDDDAIRAALNEIITQVDREAAWKWVLGQTKRTER